MKQPGLVAVVLGAVLTLGITLSCGDSQTPDGTPPGRVRDLTVVAATESTATLTWTAPGDDGDRGQAASYDLRYTLDPLPLTWDAATPVDSLMFPQPAGSPETTVVGGLTRNLTYFLALTTEDEAGNQAALSNVVQASTSDPAPPGQVTDLEATTLEPRAVTLRFTAPGDDGDAGTVVAYGVRFSDEVITESTWGDASLLEVSHIPQPAGSTEEIRVFGLTPEATVYLALRAVDDAGKAGPVSNNVEVTLPEDTVAPSAIQDLTVVETSFTTATLTWTAPGNDGNEGRAATYEVRYAETVLTEATWEAATPVAVSISPMAAGEPETLLVEGLPGESTLWFGVRTLDEAGNRSALSNVVQASTSDPAPPGQVTDLEATTLEPRAVTLRFTAPGDDGNEGTATAYEVRFSEEALTEASWPTGTPLVVSHIPQPAGTSEELRVFGLTPEATAHVALRAVDDAGKTGLVSNNVEVTLPADTVAPSRIQDLAAQATDYQTATLTWTAPGNDGPEGQAASYEVRYALEAVTEVNWESATAVAVSQYPKPAGEPETLVVDGLPGDTEVWFGARASDEAGNRSLVSNSAGVFVPKLPTVWTVRADGSGDATTVQGGIDIAGHGDVVLVYPGTYVENIDFKGKDIHLQSAEGPEVTILDGSSQRLSVVTVNSGETEAAIIEGFTITGGGGTYSETVAAYRGGGIFCQDASPTVVGNIIKGNVAGFPERGFGGGMIIDTDELSELVSVRVSDNVFQDNKAATNGGGVAIFDAVVDLSENLFTNNESQFDGGAVYIATGIGGTTSIVNNRFTENIAGDHGGGVEAGRSGSLSTPLQIQGNLFARNEAHGEDLPTDSGTGGAIAMSGWPGTIAANTFVGNMGTGGAPCTGGGILVTTREKTVRIEQNIFASSVGCAVVCRFSASQTSIANNIFWNNDPTDVGDPPDCFGNWTPANFFVDPLFCNPAADDYRVRSDSPAITGGNQIGAFLEPGCDP